MADPFKYSLMYCKCSALSRIGVITFSSVEDASAAYRKHHCRLFKGNQLRIAFHRKLVTKTKNIQPKISPEANLVVSITELSPSTTLSFLEELLPSAKFTIAMDANGYSQGYVRIKKY